MFAESLASGDVETLRKIVEPSLCTKIVGDFKTISERGYKYKVINPTESSGWFSSGKIKFGSLLIDTRTVNGAFIDRTKNLRIGD